jgi:cytochrome c-type biogenesis protein CcsB
MMTGVIVLYCLSLVFFFIAGKTRRKFFTVIEGSCLMTGWVLHSYLILKRAIEAQRFPLTDTYETLIVFAWLIVMLSFYATLRLGFRWIKFLGIIVAVCLQVFSLFINDAIRPLMPSLRSGWLYFHVGSYFIAYASFAIAFGLGIVYIINFLCCRGNNKALLDSLEGMIFQVLDHGFPFLTVGLACGSMWASISWGRFWNWDAKEVWALTTWLIYAGCLHLRHTRNLRGMNAALLAMMGFIVILFTYIGVNLFFPTLHSYA